MFIINSENTDLEKIFFLSFSIHIDMDIRKTKAPQLLRMQGSSE